MITLALEPFFDGHKHCSPLQPLRARHLFAAGKFDQYKRDIPYSTLAQASQGLIRPLLGKNESELSQWRDAFREALGPTARN